MLDKLQIVALAAASLVSASPLARRQTNETGVTPSVPEIPSTQFINYTQYYGHPGPVEVSISLKNGGRNKTAPYLYGWMHEDISHSGDGGMYGELLVNRAFQGSGATSGSLPGVPGNSIIGSENPIIPFGPVTTGWKPIGDVFISLTQLHPLSEALPIVLQLDIPFNVTGEVGILNEGWWGIDVRPQTYDASFYAKSNGPRNNGTLSGINVSLRSNLTGETWVSSKIPTTNVSSFEYEHFEAQLVNQAMAPDSNNTFAITFNASEVAGNTYYFGLTSLFGETYEGTRIRKDLGETIVGLGSKFLRFPGGNNLEGYSIDQRWKWNETIGPLINRKGRVGDWGYYNTNGLGLMEYLDFCEAGGLQPLLGLYAGFSLDIFGQEGVSFPEDRMNLVLEDILNELEFITGDVGTYWGGKRAEYGHPEPYELNYVEIGNEDWFSTTYPYRFPILYQGIKQAYPHLTIISSTFNENDEYNITIPSGGIWDKHDYQTPSFFLENFDLFDNWQQETNNEGVTIFIGESSVFQYDVPSGSVNFSNPLGIHIPYPNLMSAIGEGVYLLGAERNPSVIDFIAYAPSLANLNWENWTPNLVSFTANFNETVKSASYYMEQLFAHFRGAETLPVTTVSGDFNPLWWASSVDEGDTTMYFKVVNSGNSSIPLTIDTDRALTAANGTMITAPSLSSFNYINNQTVVAPAPITNLPSFNGQTFSWDVPAWSINVLQFSLG
ncbi:hypothetical protein PMZ80_005741 [Knufia obscura]|uniref:non-reducing end alpha-L-arabinofuranosidase n=1 Tax=Knufia obscura TaxID=1635080 RepID=A0ABR0RMF7_9EURO|nr:hypothetical protein PMZ80_005741 [Knufia obscura]